MSTGNNSNVVFTTPEAGKLAMQDGRWVFIGDSGTVYPVTIGVDWADGPSRSVVWLPHADMKLGADEDLGSRS